MLLVRTRLAPSQIHGIGLFAAQPTRAGEAVFRESIFTARFTQDEYGGMGGLARGFLDVYGYLEGGVWKLSMDNERFINHSDDRTP